jgi:plasmid stability protein
MSANQQELALPVPADRERSARRSHHPETPVPIPLRVERWREILARLAGRSPKGWGRCLSSPGHREKFTLQNPKNLNLESVYLSRSGWILSKRGSIMDPYWNHSKRIHPMPVNFSIKNVPDALAGRLRQRAARNHRSLQGELMAILEQSVTDEVSLSSRQILDEVRSLGLSTGSEATEMIREERDGR